MDNLFKYDSVELNEDGDRLIILDQTRLPGEEVFLEITVPEELYDAIYRLKVRGAPAIGVAAAIGLYVCLARLDGNAAAFGKEFYRLKEYIASSRPTAVNLTYALDRMDAAYRKVRDLPVQEIKSALLREAQAIKDDDMAMCRRIAENGLTLLRNDISVLTHCNAGHFAVSRYGTALGPVYLAHSKGMTVRVYADETRPLLQGARITAFELQKAGVDVTLICDNMVSSLMQQGKIDMVMVGCDRVAANGDTANKIGTSGVAVLAKYYGVPFYVLGPSSTIDLRCRAGADIIIEQRPAYEVTELHFSKPVAPECIEVYNPAFDVTPADLITGIVTEEGIYRYPYSF